MQARMFSATSLLVSHQQLRRKPVLPLGFTAICTLSFSPVQPLAFRLVRKSPQFNSLSSAQTCL